MDSPYTSGVVRIPGVAGNPIPKPNGKPGEYLEDDAPFGKQYLTQRYSMIDVINKHPPIRFLRHVAGKLNKPYSALTTPRMSTELEVSESVSLPGSLGKSLSDAAKQSSDAEKLQRTFDPDKPRRPPLFPDVFISSLDTPMPAALDVPPQPTLNEDLNELLDRSNMTAQLADLGVQSDDLEQFVRWAGDPNRSIANKTTYASALSFLRGITADQENLLKEKLGDFYTKIMPREYRVERESTRQSMSADLRKQYIESVEKVPPIGYYDLGITEEPFPSGPKYKVLAYFLQNQRNISPTTLQAIETMFQSVNEDNPEWTDMVMHIGHMLLSETFISAVDSALALAQECFHPDVTVDHFLRSTLNVYSLFGDVVAEYYKIAVYESGQRMVQARMQDAPYIRLKQNLIPKLRRLRYDGNKLAMRTSLRVEPYQRRNRGGSFTDTILA